MFGWEILLTVIFLQNGANPKIHDSFFYYVCIFQFIIIIFIITI